MKITREDIYDIINELKKDPALLQEFKNLLAAPKNPMATPGIPPYPHVWTTTPITPVHKTTQWGPYDITCGSGSIHILPNDDLTVFN